MGVTRVEKANAELPRARSGLDFPRLASNEPAVDEHHYWQEIQCPSGVSGPQGEKAYWWNAETKETAWEVPALLFCTVEEGCRRGIKPKAWSDNQAETIPEPEAPSTVEMELNSCPKPVDAGSGNLVFIPKLVESVSTTVPSPFTIAESSSLSMEYTYEGHGVPGEIFAQKGLCVPLRVPSLVSHCTTKTAVLENQC